jgi:thiosulfate dehydrogenase [quinone] large subunit
MAVSSVAVREAPAVTPREDAEPSLGSARGLRVTLGLLRISMGFLFLWSFLDRMFGLGFNTGRAQDGAITFFGHGTAWLRGGSPTAPVLLFATRGPFRGFYQWLGGCGVTGGIPSCTHTAWLDWGFMLSMLAIGVALVLGIGTRLAVIGGMIWMVFLYTATDIWPQSNPFVDLHVLIFLTLLAVAFADAGRYVGLGRAWRRTRLVRAVPILA